jgi:hypothetical protein
MICAQRTFSKQLSEAGTDRRGATIGKTIAPLSIALLVSVPCQPFAASVPAAQPEAGDTNCAQTNELLAHPCPCCGGRMVIIEIFQRGSSPRTRPAAATAVIRIDTS